jgi:DNA-binding SARP family transcriptional activator/Tfp pilus assembly protein PilF
MFPVTVSLLGPPRIERNGKPVKLYGSKTMALVAYLAVTGKGHPRNTLATLLWPESDQPHARAALRLTLVKLKNDLGAEWLEVERESVTLKCAADWWLDVEHFHNLLTECRTHDHAADQVCGDCLAPLTQAADLYRDDFMAGYSLSDSAAFDDWQLYQSESLRRELASALEKLVCGHSARGEFEPAIAHARRWLALNPLHEPAQRCLMNLYAQVGQRAEALRQYQECAQMLRQELGITPQEETARLYQAIQENRKSDPITFPLHFHQPNANQIRPGTTERLVPFLAPPLPTHTLVGREELLKELKRRLLEDENVLIALQGLPGVGKTALVIELAHDPEVRAHFCDGMLWAGLGRQPDVLALLGTWVAAMQVPAEEIARRTSPTERAWGVHAAIGLRRMLLVIDDAWQADAALALKVGGPNCAYIVTTRVANVALDLAGGDNMLVRELDTVKGVELLMQLAPQVAQAEPEETRALVQAVGGLPLALILMGRHLRKVSRAAQSRRMRQALTQLQAVQARLQLVQPQSSLEQPPDLPLQTPLSLQASIGLSDVALDATARQALRDLSLFPPKPNTFSEAAALAVIDQPASVLDMLTDHGFLESVGPDRYTMHQTIADYARFAREARYAHDAHLEKPGTETAGRFVRYFVQHIAEHAAENDLLDLERDNFLVALELAANHQMREELVHGLDALHPFLVTRGLYAVAELHLSRALNLMPEAHDAERYTLLLAREKAYEVLGRREVQRQDLDTLEKLAEVLNDQSPALGGLRRAQVALRRSNYAKLTGNYAAAIAAAQAAIELAQVAQDVGVQAEGHLQLGLALERQGDYAAARVQLEQALRLVQEAKTGNSTRSLLPLEAEGWVNLGIVAFFQCDHASAEAYFEQSLRFYREMGDRMGESKAINNLGNVCKSRGDSARAWACYEQSLRISREIGDRQGESITLDNLGLILGEDGEYARARTHHEQSLAISREIGDRSFECNSLTNLGLLSHQIEDHETAREHAEQAIRIAIDIGARRLQSDGLTILGHALAGLGQWAEAAAAYQRALDVRRELGQHNLAMESLAGLARISLARGELALAQTRVKEILSYLETNTLDGTEEPFRVYLTCYQVFKAEADPRASDILGMAYHLLQARAAQIGDEALRGSFLENVPAHRELMKEWAGQSGNSAILRRPANLVISVMNGPDPTA